MNQIQAIIRLTFAGAFCLSVVLVPETAFACPTCKDSLHQNNAATGYAISIMFMMAMPLLIASYWAFTIWRLRRLHANKLAATTAETLAVEKVA
ncbi:MAG: hypothetical protein AAF456_19965 [Planctomycetota bacterium]